MISVPSTCSEQPCIPSASYQLRYKDKVGLCGKEINKLEIDPVVKPCFRPSSCDLVVAGQSVSVCECVPKCVGF